jgi:hypothetical protein
VSIKRRLCLQVIAKPHLLLVTLLLCNAAVSPSVSLLSVSHFFFVSVSLAVQLTYLPGSGQAMEALPLFLDRLLDPLLAIILSVTAVLTFGGSLCVNF